MFVHQHLKEKPEKDKNKKDPNAQPDDKSKGSDSDSEDQVDGCIDSKVILTLLTEPEMCVSVIHSDSRFGDMLDGGNRSLLYRNITLSPDELTHETL